MNRGGIGIREFEKVFENPDESFLEACEIYKSRIKNDNDAKEHSKLYNLNDFKSNPAAFVSRVNAALDFIEIRKANKAFRKGKKIEGIEIVYDDEKCFIVRPLDKKYSRKAAYIDNGTAPWCIAAPAITDVYGNSRQSQWESYRTSTVFYVFPKKPKNKKDGWAVLLSEIDAFRLKHNLEENQIPYTLIENRENKTGSDDEKKRQTYSEMLQGTGLPDEKFKEIVKKYADANENENWRDVFIDVPSKPDSLNLFKEVEKYRSIINLDDYSKRWILMRFASNANLEALKYLVDEKGLDFKVFDSEYEACMSCTTKKHRKCLEFFLDRGVDVNAGSELRDMTILGAVAAYGDLDTLKYLVERGADIYLKSKSGANLFNQSGKNVTYKVEMGKYLKSLGLSPVQKWDFHNNEIVERAVTTASGENGLEYAKFIFENGMSVEKYGALALYDISYFGFFHRHDFVEGWKRDEVYEKTKRSQKKFMELLDWLLERGAVDRKNACFPRGALDNFIMKNYVECARKLLEKGMRPFVPVYRLMKDHIRRSTLNGVVHEETEEYRLSDEMLDLMKEFKIEVLPEGDI